MRPAHTILLLPMLAYVCVAIIWYEQGINPITGDEPHYLLAAESLVQDGDLLVVNNHTADTPVSREVPPGALLRDTHSYNGYSLHGLGLPLLLAPAYALAGVPGAKVFMALVIGLAPLAIYRLARSVLADDAWAITIAVLVGLGQPFITASNQIYPDLLAGLIVFFLLVRWARADGPSSGRQAVLDGLLMASLPWLHLKLVLPTATLCAFVLWRALRPAHPYPGHPGRSVAWMTSLIVGLSIGGLAVYHQAAFHAIVGPYARGDATADPRRVGMIIAGLHLDRMQGLFVQAPLLLLGVFGLAFFAAERGTLAALVGLLYLSVMLPNAAHTNWYGGFSFAGRFHWFGALLWVFPLVYAVKHLRERGRLRVVRRIMLVALLLQIVFVSKVLIPNAYVYNLAMSRAASWMESDPYADFLDLTPLERARFLPSFRDFATYAVAPTSWIASGFVLSIACGGYCVLRGRRKAALGAGAIVLACSAAALWLAQPPIHPLEVKLIQAPGTDAGADAPARPVANQPTGSTVLAGPLVPLRPGRYALELEYVARGAGERGLTWTWISASGEQEPLVLAAGVLPSRRAGLRRLIMLGTVPRASDDTGVGLRLHADVGVHVSARRLLIRPLPDP